MKRSIIASVSALAVATAVFWALPGLASAQKGGKNGPTTSTATAAISVHAGSTLWLGGMVSFDTTVPSGVKYPRIEIMCNAASDGSQIWAVTGTNTETFVLGGASSPWLDAPQAVHCQADLYENIWNGNNPQQRTIYASTTFDAAAAPA
jgi:hypothetical protein